jgi:hypothetical protein
MLNDRLPATADLWRYREAARIVMAAVRLRTIDPADRYAANKLFENALNSKDEALIEWRRGLECELAKLGLRPI